MTIGKGKLSSNEVDESGSDDIVITGMSGTFPGADNIDEFEYKLYNKIDMVSKETRFDFIYLDQPERAGTINVNNKFDTGFFGIHERQAEYMDGGIRIILEKCTEAILDAGLNPSDLEHKKTGVFVGACVSETEIYLGRRTKPNKSFYWTGNVRCMLTNRISYFFKLKGPSFTTDTACSSSLYALDHAYNAMKRGEIDMAIVGGSNLCSFAGTTIQFARLGVLSHDGICKVFDEKADGYVRAEGVCVLILQKKKDAHRIYGTLIHSKTNCDGYKDEGITYPSGEAQYELMREFYQECGVQPHTLSYLEAHGTGTKVGDPEECDSIDQIFTKNRDKPLLIGSVKSCVGHSEPVSGCMSVMKSLLALEKGAVAPNLHFQVPKPEIKPIVEGRLKVVTDVTKLEDDKRLIGINSFGFGGGNCHILIQGNMKEKINNGIPADNLPRLVCVSGRKVESVETLCTYIESVGIDAEFIGLIHKAFRKNIPNHLYRGYIILSKKGILEKSVNTGKFAFWYKPSVNIVFGKLDNWYPLLKNFIEVGVFGSSLKRLAKLMTSLNLDATILSGKMENRRCSDILGSVIVQICLADLLKALKITPSMTIGFSFGELVCAYFDGVLKLEEVLQCANIFNTEFGKDGRINSTVSTKDPKLRNDLIKKLLKILSRPKIWNGRTVSAEYFADAALSYKSDKPKNFIRTNSIVLEIGKNNISINVDDYENVQCMEFPEKFADFLRILGNMYQLGYDTATDQLYPAIKFPVGRGTPKLSSQIMWNHLRTYATVQPPKQHVYMRTFTIDLRKADWTYITGHVIDGRILFPAAGYLCLAWEVFAEDYKVQDSFAVMFENVRFIRATSMLPSDPVVFVVAISDSGYFEITERDAIVVTGFIKEVPNESKAFTNIPEPVCSDSMMTTKDIYQELRLRGYNYQGQFQALEACDITGVSAKVQWIENYVTFIDNLFQMKILSHDTRLLYVPTHLYKVTILPILHRKYLKRFENKENTILLPAFYCPQSDLIKCGGIQVQLLSASPIPRRKNLATPVLEVYEFVPNETELPAHLSIRVNAQIIAENSSLVKSIPSVEILEPTVGTDPDILILTPALMQAIGDMPLVQADARVFSLTPLDVKDVNVVNNLNLRAEAKVYALIIGTKLLQNKQVLEDAFFALWDNGFIVSRESTSFSKEDIQDLDLVLVSVHRTGKETIIMLAKSFQRNPVFVKITDEPDFLWIPNLQSTLKTHTDVVIYSEHEQTSGILGFVNCLKKEPEVKNLQAMFIVDQDKSFDSSDPTIIEQLNKNLTVNVYKNGQWGTYRHLPIPADQDIEAQHVFLGQLTTGDLSSLRWMEGPLNGAENKERPPGYKLVEIHYCALNFKDIMIASGKLAADAVCGYQRCQITDVGTEFSGIDQDGNRIMGMVDVGGLSSRILANSVLTWNVPDEWSLDEAATVPVVYSTMMYGLCMRGQMKRGDSILIHSGVGGVGQAAIRYCLFHGVTVFATVGNQQRKEVLRKLFPELPESHIGNSHDTSFEVMIKKETKGRGVDLVLNSLAEEKLLASARCLAKGGRMIEIGKYDIKSNNMLNLILLKKEASFHGVMLDMFFTITPVEMKTISQLMKDGIKAGCIKPLDRQMFKYNEVEQAFRFMAGGKHLGKVIVQIREEDKNIDHSVLCSQRFPSIPRFNCDPKKSYVLVGGLGGFGLELTDWLILRGAKKIILSSSRGFTTGYQRQRVNLWESYGVVIRVTTVDLSKKSGCIQLLKEAKELGPIDAIFNLAVCLKDALFGNQTAERYKKSLTPKAYVTKHLDELTRTMCPGLRNFVIFSSVSCGKGNVGQTNYGMANSIMERICEARQKDGYPGKAIEWGAIGEVGILGEMMENNAAEINIGGTLLQKISNCLQVMDILLLQSSPIVSSIVVAEKTRGSYSTENAIEAVASILGVSDLKSVSFHSTLAEMGMDSMTSVEIKQMLEREFDIFLSPKEIRTLTLSRLQEIQNSKESEQFPKEVPTLDMENLPVIKTLLFSTIVDETESQILHVRMSSKVMESANAPTILVIPGIEGFVKNLEPLSEKLEAHVIGLQFNYTEAPETIFDMARIKLPLAEKYLSKNIPFNIVAYSYGVAEALEMVALLETKGYTGTVYCIDGAPSVMNNLLENALGNTPDEVETNALLRILMVYNVPLTGLQKISLEYKTCKSVEEKIDKTLEVYGKLVPYSSEYLGRLIRGTVKRILAISTYKPTYSVIKSDLVLLKPTEPTYSHTTEDFGLSDICKAPVPVYQIEGNHTSMISNDDLSKYINSDL